jgi:uncharacterized protein (DUF2147 family)
MNAQSIAGIWNTGQDNTKIEITEKSGVYSGNVVSSDNAEVKIGKLFLKEVKSSGGKWKGKLYSPKKDTWYNAVLEEKGNLLLVTVKAGITNKTIEWKKG